MSVFVFVFVIERDQNKIIWDGTAESKHRGPFTAAKVYHAIFRII